MKIRIITDYEQMAIHYNNWATAEDTVDWRREHFEATRCTVAFAAVELRSFLERILTDAEIAFSSQADGDVNIRLETEQLQGKDGDYKLIPVTDGVKIIGKTRVGVLYGVYELLKLQGYRWHSPDSAGGTHVPEKTDSLILPEKELTFAPAMDLWRGFDFEGHLPGNAMWLWMARNRLNGVRPQPGCVGMQNKLGMMFKCGGHIFEWILAPDCVLPDGKTVWEAKREWYGVRKDGGEITRTNALRTQFCVSKEDLCDYLSQNIIHKLKTEWVEADRLDIWGFDTWGSTCCCEDCKKLGNGTDRTLHFLSRLRAAIDQSDLDRKVELVVCSYGGTCTLEPPENDIPQNLIDAGDIMVFYPITRCYRHHLDEKPCYENEFFQNCLEGWLKKKPAMPVIMGEYYDCSKFEEIPAVLMDVMCYDIPKYCQMGIRGITYMHVPVSNWGVKAITQWIYSNLSWDPNMDKKALLDDYFIHRYGENAEPMRKVYANLQTALEDIQTWRSWAPESLLSQFQIWNGGVPTRPLVTRDHYRDHADIIEKGRHFVSLMKESAEIIRELKKKYFTNLPDVKELPLACNPAEISVLMSSSQDDFNLGEDLRLINYGIDAMTLMTATAAYYDALYAGKPSGAIWAEVEETYRRMDGYFMCISNTYAYFGGTCPSGIKRTQMETTIRRCASYRKNHLSEMT